MTNFDHMSRVELDYFAAGVKKLLHEAGVQKKDFAEIIDLNKNSFSAIINRKRGCSVEKRLQISAGFDMAPHEIVAIGAEEKGKPDTEEAAGPPTPHTESFFGYNEQKFRGMIDSVLELHGQTRHDLFFLRETLSCLPVGLLIIDATPDNTCLFANRRAIELMGNNPVHKHCKEWCPNSHICDPECLLEKVRTTTLQQHGVRQVENESYSVVATPLMKDGAVTAIALMLCDMYFPEAPGCVGGGMNKDFLRK